MFNTCLNNIPTFYYSYKQRLPNNSTLPGTQIMNMLVVTLEKRSTWFLVHFEFVLPTFCRVRHGDWSQIIFFNATQTTQTKFGNLGIIIIIIIMNISPCKLINTLQMRLCSNHLSNKMSLAIFEMSLSSKMDLSS